MVADGTFSYYFTKTQVTPDYLGTTERRCSGRWMWDATRRVVCTSDSGRVSRAQRLRGKDIPEERSPWTPRMSFTVVSTNPMSLELRYVSRNGGVHRRVFVKRSSKKRGGTVPVMLPPGSPPASDAPWKDLTEGVDEYLRSGAFNTPAAADDSHPPIDATHSAAPAAAAAAEPKPHGALVPATESDSVVHGEVPPSTDTYVDNTDEVGADGGSRRGEPVATHDPVDLHGVVGRYIYHESVPYQVGTGSADGEIVLHEDGHFNYSYSRTREDKHYTGTTLRTATGTYSVPVAGCVTCQPSAGRRKKTERYADDKAVVEVAKWIPQLTFFSVRVAAFLLARLCAV